MAVSQALADLLVVAVDEVEGDPRHILTLPTRRSIWSLLGSDASPASEALALHRLAKLDIACADRVLVHWQAVFPNDQLAAHLVSLASQTLNGTTAVESAKREANNAWTEIVDNRSYDQITLRAMYAGCAAISAVYSAFGTAFDPINQDLDEDLEPDALDASYFAASAEAGGMNHQPFASNADRRDFWLWYLKKAIPTACE